MIASSSLRYKWEGGANVKRVANTGASVTGVAEIRQLLADGKHTLNNLVSPLLFIGRRANFLKNLKAQIDVDT